MKWRHYEAFEWGVAQVRDEAGDPMAAPYSLGCVRTGNSRVFVGYFVQMTLTNGMIFTGEDRRSLRSALRRLASSLADAKLGVRWSGLDQRWQESGLSADTGWGYFELYPEAVHMLAAVPQSLQTKDGQLEQMIAEAISTMKIGLEWGAAPSRVQPTNY